MIRRRLPAAALILLATVATVAAARAVAASGLPATRPATTSDDYRTALRYAQCMRAHGVPHPDPAPDGSFALTRAQDERLRSVPRSRRLSANRACARILDSLRLPPLSPRAKRRALRVLAEVRSCLLRAGYDLGTPVVRDLGNGRAFFGFRNENHLRPTARLQGLEYRCEHEVGLAKRIDRIVAEDRAWAGL